MTGEIGGPGRLLAVEGVSGKALGAAAKTVLRALKKRAAVSGWDSSNTFFELGLAIRKLPSPSPRTLLLLYASDLAFRLRWEIQPALKEGRVVVAAPYVETAVALGLALDLRRHWLDDLLEFAPRPEVSFRVKEEHKVHAGKGRPSGFVEFCCRALSASGGPVTLDELAPLLTAHFDAWQAEGGCRVLTRAALRRFRPGK
jgi:hypothetical protein